MPGFVFVFVFVCLLFVVFFFSFCFFYQISALNNTLLSLSNSLIVFCNTGAYPFAMFIYIPIPKGVTNSLDKNVSIRFLKELYNLYMNAEKAVAAALSYLF